MLHILALGQRLVEVAAVKNYRSILFAAAAIGFAVGSSVQAAPEWLTDYKKAQQEAKTSNRLLEADFPRAKAQAVGLKKQNQELAQQYQIQGFPTIIVLNGDGQKIGELGYMEGGVASFIAELEKLRKG